jgi:hypothetical protein
MIALLHPGDFSLGEWIWFFGYIFVLVILPMGIGGFVLYKIIRSHSSNDNDKQDSNRITFH